MCSGETANIEQNSGQFLHRKLLNVTLLGAVFMMLASRTPISIVKTVMYSAREVNGTGYVEGFTGDGYVANAVLYATFAMSNFLAPSVISLIGPRYRQGKPL